MTPPDPRFRDKLARLLHQGHDLGGDVADCLFCWDDADALLPLIAAEVEARVQAAANQRAVEGGPLRCTYCGEGLVVYSETVGPAYLTYETPESIQCRECDATWEPDGTLRDPAKWVRWPNLYPPPAALAQPAPAAPDEEGRA